MVSAQRDALTGLYNKENTQKAIDAILRKKEAGASHGFLIMDMDHFKEINDNYGHIAGDKALKAFGELLQKQFREQDVVGRIGGDEFVMLIENPEKQEAEQIIQNVRDKLARHREEGGLRVSSATGTAEGNGIDILKIVHDADERMYEDKKRGKESREYAMFYSE